MKKWDEVKLNTTIEELSSKGIHKGYKGTIIKDNGNGIFTIWFSNPKNMGEFAFAKINKQFLDFLLDNIYSEDMINEMENFIKNLDIEKHDRLTEINIKELDKVELVVDKPQYNKEGIYKGAHGCIMQPYAIKNAISVEFYNIENHKYGCIEIMVNINDIRVID